MKCTVGFGQAIFKTTVLLQVTKHWGVQTCWIKLPVSQFVIGLWLFLPSWRTFLCIENVTFLSRKYIYKWSIHSFMFLVFSGLCFRGPTGQALRPCRLTQVLCHHCHQEVIQCWYWEHFCCPPGWSTNQHSVNIAPHWLTAEYIHFVRSLCIILQVLS